MMKKKLSKKKLFSFLAVLIVLGTVLCVSVFADEGQQLGNVKTSQTSDLDNILSDGWSPSQDVKQWLFDNPYTIVIDIQALYTALQRDVTSSYLVLNVKQYYDGSLDQAVPSSVRSFQVHFEADYNNNPYEYVSVTIDNDVVSLPWAELTTSFQKYLLVPCFDFSNSSFFYSSSFSSASGIEGPNPVFMIFNNAQWQGALNGSQYDEAEIARINYNIGFQEGYLEGQEYSNSIGEGGAQLITAVVEAPVNVFTRMLNFEIFGVNVLGFVVAILSFALVIAILKKVV